MDKLDAEVSFTDSERVAVELEDDVVALRKSMLAWGLGQLVLILALLLVFVSFVR